LLLLVGVAVLAGGGYYWLVGFGVQPLSEKSLTFAEIRRATIRDIVSATGLIEPRETVVVSAKTAGIVVRLVGKIGDAVREGDDLATLDDAMIKLKEEEASTGVIMADAAIRQAKSLHTQAVANKDAAERNLKIQQELKNAGGVRHEYEQALAQVDGAKAGIKAAEAGIDVANAKKQEAETARKQAELVRDMTRIKVPSLSLNGSKREFLILDRKVFEGQMVGPQSGPLFTLAGNLDVVEVHAQVAEGDINKVREGLTAVFKIKNYDDEDADFEGVVKKVRHQASTVGKGGVYFDTVIEVKNRKDPKTNDWQLRPGMTASIDIIRYEHKNVWRVPIDALNFTLEEAYQSESAKACLREWKAKTDQDWRAIWTWDDASRQAIPVFVRILPKNGEIALKDAEGNEILQWEAGREPAEMLRVITKAPPAHPPGFFDKPTPVKI
jgi:multidrug efflux pump subunit AcrA (membrane-fusion protein)